MCSSDLVFPGPVWFEKEYDLGLLYPEDAKIHHAMLLISGAAAVRPDARPSMLQFVDGLRAIAGPTPIQVEETMTIKLQRAEALIEVEFQQRRASTATFIQAVHADLHRAIARLHQGSPEIKVWKQWFDEAKRTPQTADALVRQVAENESEIGRAHV